VVEAAAIVGRACLRDADHRGDAIDGEDHVAQLDAYEHDQHRGGPPHAPLLGGEALRVRVRDRVGVEVRVGAGVRVRG